MRNPMVQGILLMIAAMFLFSWMNIFVRHAYEYMHSTQIVFIRNAMTLVLMSLWLKAFYPKGFFKTNRTKSLFVYCLTGVIAIELWFYGLTQMSLNDATALSFTAPVFVTLFAILLLKEKATWVHWASIFLGLVGALIILRPGVMAVNHAAMVVLASAALMAVSSIIVKTLTNTEHPDKIVFYQGVFMTPLSLPFALMDWQPVSPEALFWIFMVTLSSVGAHLLLNRAFKLCDMVMLMPFDFFRLLFTAILAWLAFNETLDILTVAGGILIISGAVWGASHGNEEVRRILRRAMTLGKE